MKCGFMRQIEARESAKEEVIFQGKVLYVGERAVKIWTPIENLWIPLSQILESDPEKDEMEEGDEVTMIIPAWLAREKGLIE